MITEQRLINILTYGTLKRGYHNHDRFCKGVRSIEPAVVRGRLYEMASGIPMLRVPDEDILAHGTNDPIADVGTQDAFETDAYRCCDDNEDCVYGELMTFDDPITRLPLIDRLEGFRPDGSSLYRRVLVYVYSGAEAIPAWCYVIGDYAIRNLLPTGKVAWP
ncbi:MAG: gamma-glutamylcyclotransferase family protein [Armatimonadota bacterium]